MKKLLITIMFLIAVLFMGNIINALASDNSTAVETADESSDGPC